MRLLIVLALLGFVSCQSEAEKMHEENNREIEKLDRQLSKDTTHLNAVKILMEAGLSEDSAEARVKRIEAETYK